MKIMSGDLAFLDDNLFNQLLNNPANSENRDGNFNPNDEDSNQLNQSVPGSQFNDENQFHSNSYSPNHPHSIIIINSSTEQRSFNDSPTDETLNLISIGTDQLSTSRSPSSALRHHRGSTDHTALHGNIVIPQDSQDDLIDHEYETDYSIYENKSGLAEDMKFLASMPELCDVTFLVGETREPVCAVRSVLAARSRTFQKLLYAHKHQNQLSVLSSVTNNTVQANNGTSNLGTNLNSSNTTNNGNNNSITSNLSSREGDSESSSYISNDSQREKQLKYSKSRKFRETSKETKLKLFLKRSSEPSLNGLPINHHPHHNGHHHHSHQLTVQSHQTMIIEEFEPDVFRQLIEYIHTGCVTLQARTLLGLLNAADYYSLEELRRACLGFVSCCITVDTVCALLASAERYIQYKCTKSLVQRVLEFVDQHGNDVLSLGSFTLLPEHVVRLILSREELKADELTKFHAALSWSQRYCDASPGGSTDLREVMSGFFECIEFYKIPATVLMREVHPLGVVPDHVIMNALAFQADPRSVDLHKIESPNRFRRMTLPHALNIAGSDLLNLHAASAARSERSASTSTSGYISNSDLNHITNSSAAGQGFRELAGASSSCSNSGSTVGYIGGRKESGEMENSSCEKVAIPNGSEAKDSFVSTSVGKEEKSKGKGKEKDKSWRDKLGKRKASRPFRRAKTLMDSN